MLPPELIEPEGAPDLTGTFVERMPPPVAAQLLAGSLSFTRRPGALIFDTSDPRPHVGLVLSGTARAFLTAADGRQLTVRYAKRGSIVGQRSDLSGDHAPISVRAKCS